MNTIVIQAVILILGFVVLIKGADYFVDGASSIAKNLNVPDIFIGLTIVAFGTSAPEAAVSIKAMLSHNTDMVLGNIIGSNILNIVLILGIAASIAPIRVQNNTIKKEIPFLLLVSILLSVLFLDIPLQNGNINMISRGDGIVILIVFTIFIYYLLHLAKNGQSEEIEARYPLKLAIAYSFFGLIAIIIGGNFVVNAATKIATSAGVSQRFIALTIVALGTSLPELVTSVMAAKKGKQDIAIGNIIGSNIFNICFVAGLPAALFGNIIPKDPIGLDLLVMVFCTIVLYIFSKSERIVSKSEGKVFLIMFAIYYGYLVFTQLNVFVA
ncbi:calcium/sodium antiporter [Cellulosilyticum sp. I15G10I2]|uniref:calcium/sodium antiporter n=1 Tax=Cellulosilyticum sp. I15G10I2 TaxID=1892843 RepID=UPI00085CBA63|nr:calcium/sodium antiporter [Cellulosilyticum sp. I15G10I2]